MPDYLGTLASLPGTWRGHGFNTIWRPNRGSNDRFLELNLTTEILTFARINGSIPNRGHLAPDINLSGLIYTQEVSETSSGTGLHLETGMWANVPPAAETGPETVMRMASIAHGTVVLAQGTGQVLQGGPSTVPRINIIPAPVGAAPPSHGDFATAVATFPELDLSVASGSRHVSPGVTQALIQDPNQYLQSAIQQEVMQSRTFIQVSTTPVPITPGGGIANSAYLVGEGDPQPGNGKAVEVDASFWIQTLAGRQGRPNILQLQYSQIVQLEFNGLRWPHCSVATLRKE